jgi:hypothetical protein
MLKGVKESGAEFWSARELARVLEYREFRNLSAAIAKAREACAQSGHAVSDHFVLFNEMVGIGSGAQGAQGAQNHPRAGRHDAGEPACGRKHQESLKPGEEAAQGPAKRSG